MGEVIQMFSRVGRNDPCPCGSGKKYKKCCMSVHEEKDRLQQRLQEEYIVTDKYFNVHEYITINGYTLTNFDFFFLELLNVIGEILYKYKKTDKKVSKDFLYVIYKEAKDFYNACEKCEIECLIKPMEYCSLQSLIDKGWKLEEYPEQFQKPLFINLFYFEFFNLITIVLRKELNKELNETDTEEISSTIYGALFDYVADNCLNDCKFKCMIDFYKNAYCRFCSFSRKKLPCPRKGDISYLEIEATEEDMIE